MSGEPVIGHAGSVSDKPPPGTALKMFLAKDVAPDAALVGHPTTHDAALLAVLERIAAALERAENVIDGMQRHHGVCDARHYSPAEGIECKYVRALGAYERAGSRPPRTCDPVTGNLDTWCAWHERWEMSFGCTNCDSTLPVCYLEPHIYYSCPNHPDAKLVTPFVKVPPRG